MTEAKIRSRPNDELQYRSQEIKANGKTIITPIKSLDPNKIDPTVSLNKKIENINEIYAGLTKEKIANHMLGEDRSLTYSLRRTQNRIKNLENEVSLCFLEYKEMSIPNSKEIEFITDQAYVNSDITPLPLLSKFTDRITSTFVDKEKKKITPNDGKFEKILKFLENAIETIEQLSSKPIMGYVPDYRYYFDRLIGSYLDKGINTFYFDAHSSNPITLQSSLRALMRVLNQNGALEKSFIYMLNPGSGRAIKDSYVIPAKDILGYGLGVDCLGGNHMRITLPKEIRENMKKNPDNRSRLFNKKSYGYLKTSDSQTIKQNYPKDSGIDVTNFLTDKKPKKEIENSFNVEQLSLEAIALRDKITSSKTMLKYISGKSDIKKDDLKILEKAKIKEKR